MTVTEYYAFVVGYIILQHGDVDTKEKRYLKVKLDDAEFAVAAKGIENVGSSTESRRYLATAKNSGFDAVAAPEIFGCRGTAVAPEL